MRKIKELCSSLPKGSRPNDALDNVITKIFKPTEVADFIQSQSPPERRYLIKVDQNAMHHHNDRLENFNQCGPNERYLINKIFFSPFHLLYVVGGIGVGKTTFSHYLINHLLPRALHQESRDPSRCPTAIYFDFLKELNISVERKSFEEIESEFFTLLCNRVEAEIGVRGYFDLTKEVGEVWEKILVTQSKSHERNPAFSYILKRLYEEEARTLPSDGELHLDTISRRKKIRSEVIQNMKFRGHYLAQLLRHIRDEFYDGHKYCLLIIIDNIDREPPIVQRAVGLAIKPFANNSEIRIIVNARQTTFHQGQGDNLSEAVDWVAYCGPSPLDIINARLDSFIQSPQGHEEFYSPAKLPTLVKGIREIKDTFLRNDRFTSFFQSLCGRSIRKGLVIAQSIFYNSLYDPYEIGRVGVAGANLRMSDILRAIMIGSSDAYAYDANDMIENVFQVQKQKGESNLIKLRILKALSMSDGLILNRLFNILKGFNYSAELIVDALNEMLLKSKRLIWSDSVKGFISVEDLMAHGHSRLIMGSNGRGYLETVCKKVEYLQEVMLDTSIHLDYLNHFGSGWSYGKMEDRLGLVSRFCSFLVMQDMEEVNDFVANYNPKEFRKVFGTGNLLSREILESVMQDIAHILGFVIDHARGTSKESLIEFQKEYMAYYDDWRLKAVEFEKRLLHVEVSQ
jgi:hypothetical protein